jgi:hypothetical protein
MLNFTLRLPQFFTVKLNHCRCPRVLVSIRRYKSYSPSPTRTTQSKLPL